MFVNTRRQLQQNMSSSLLRVLKRTFTTIYSVSSGQGKCGVAVLRISGPQCQQVMSDISGLKVCPSPRTAVLRKLRHPQSGKTIDRGLVLFFPKPFSFTGEDVVEFHVHGGRAVVTAMLSAISEVPSCTPAQPGEFTRRAFLNGKMDLTEVEGLADLLSAETEAQREQALLQMEGHLGKIYKSWANKLTKCMAFVEAFIDFSEDDNIEDGVIEKVNKQVNVLLLEIRNHLKDGRRGEILRSGVQVSIVGEPNVGKSSLLNILAQRPAAIVTPIAGTTRDVVQLSLDLGGFPVQLADTAGLREISDEIEKEGIDRARKSAKRADLVLLVASAPNILTENNQNLQLQLEDYIKRCGLDVQLKDCIVVLNKADLLNQNKLELPQNIICTSCENGDGLTELIESIREKLSFLCGEPKRECPTITQARHRSHLESCVIYLEKYLVFEGKDLVIAAEQLRLALRHLGMLTGKVSTEQLLDIIFSEFCIGK